VAIALLPVLGRPVSPATVSAVAKQLDAAAFHCRPLKDIYRVLVLDGVVLRRKTGAGALARPVLVALGLRPDGKKEVIDFHLATAESAAQWEQFLGDLVRRGLSGEHLEMLCVDGLPGRSGVGAPLPNPTGQSGLLAALPMAFPDIPLQRCWAHSVPIGHTRCQEGGSHDLTRAMSVSLYPPAGGSPVRVVARELGSRLPASGGNARRRSAASKALLGEQSTGPQHDANSAAS
jgi:Transposase, Mutator family